MSDELCDWSGLVRRAGSPARARTWLRSGLWWRVLRGAYARWDVEDGALTRARALRLVLPPHAALSHRGALWLLGLDVLGDALDATTPRGLRLQSRPGVRVHSAELADADLCDVGGLLVVSAARAVVDVARSESVAEAVALGDAVLRHGAATAGLLHDVLDRSVGLRGVRQARAAVDLMDGRSESAMESRLRLPLVTGGLEVEVQVDLYDDAGHVGRVDLVADGVVVEFDGRAAHLQDTAFTRERRRQSRLLEAGAALCRFTAADVYGRSPGSLVAEVHRAVDRDRSVLRRGPDTLRPPRSVPLPTRADRRAA